MAGVANPGKSFYVAGGNLLPDAQSYVVRPADSELFDSIVNGHYCYVLTSRQMGKSSLMHRTSARLTEAGIIPILLDLTGIGANLNAEQWYFGLLAEIGKQMSLKAEFDAYWTANTQHGPLYRFIHAISDIMLEKTESPIAIFIDEIDFIRGLRNFSTDEFFAAIRQCFNGRANDPRLRRLTFCLLGVATPADLIRDVHTTPFNIGVQIELGDFTKEEASELSAGLDSNPAMAWRKMERILHWTGGHPYLTQKLCLSMSERPGAGIDYVDKLCHEMFLASGVRRTEDNLIFVHNTLRNGMEDSTPVLRMYRQVLKGARVPNDHSDPIVGLLRLAGVVRAVDGRLLLRNTIYARVFDKAWVVENMPDADLRRERAAYRRGLMRAGAFFGTIAVLVGILAWVALYQANHARIETRIAHTSETQAFNYLYVADMNLAQQDLNRFDIQAALVLLGQHKNDIWKSFDWNWLNTSIFSGRQASYEDNVDVFCSAFSPDGSMFVQGRSGGAIAVWRSPFTGPPLILPVAESLIRGIAFTDNGRDLALLTTTGKVQNLRNVHTFLLVRSWKVGGQWFYGLAASPDGSKIAVGGDLGVQMFNSMGKPGATYTPGPSIECNAVAISHNQNSLVMGCNHNSAWVWDLRSGKQMFRLRQSGMVNGVAFSPDDKTIATASFDKTVVLWDAKTGRSLHVMQHTDSVYSVAFSSDGKWLTTGGRDFAVRIWDTKTGKKLKEYAGQSGTLNTVCFSPNGRLLASSGYGGLTIIWKINLTSDTISLHGAPPPDNPSGYIFSNSGKWLATSDTRGWVIVWDANTGRMVHTFKKFSSNACRLVSFGPNDAYLLIGRVGQPLRLYETTHWSLLPGGPGSGLLIKSPYILSPNGRFLAEAGQRKVTLWDTLQQRIVWTTPGQQVLCDPIAFSPDGLKFATVSGLSTVTFWSTVSGQSINHFQALKRPNYAGIFSPDGKDLIMGSDDGSISCWNVDALRQTITLPGQESVYALAFTPDGKTLKSITASNRIHLWHADIL